MTTSRGRALFQETDTAADLAIPCGAVRAPLSIIEGARTHTQPQSQTASDLNDVADSQRERLRSESF